MDLECVEDPAFLTGRNSISPLLGLEYIYSCRIMAGTIVLVEFSLLFKIHK
jgi:hypothetical protein